jgi:hypothetical protein
MRRWREHRPFERRKSKVDDVTRVERQGGSPSIHGPGDREWIAHRRVAGQLFEHAWNPRGNAGAHEHVADTGQHAAVDRWEMRELDLLEIVDPDGMTVAFSREETSTKLAAMHSSASSRGAFVSYSGSGLNGRPGAFSAGHVILLPDPLRDGRQGELIQPPPHMTAGIARRRLVARALPLG